MDNDAESQQSGENKSVPKTDDDEQQLVAGRKPAGKLEFFPWKLQVFSFSQPFYRK